MVVRKVFRHIRIDFNILSDKLDLSLFDVIEDICITFEDLIILNKDEPFDTLVSKQQKNNKHALISNPKELDVYRIFAKMIDAFLIVTKQSINFSLESIIISDEMEIIVHNTDIYLGSISELTFSPSSRSHWKHPQIINEIIKFG